MTREADDTPGVVARPPRLYLLFLAAGLALQYAWPVPMLPAGTGPAVRYGGGLALFALGLATMTAAVRGFRHAGTPVETYRGRRPPWSPTASSPGRVTQCTSR